MEPNANRSSLSKLAIVWLAIVLMGSFWLTMRGTSDPISIAVIPQAPREGDPVIATFKLNNPSSESKVIQYQLFANGKLLTEGSTTVGPSSGKTYKYAYENRLQMGEQLSFMVRSKSDQRINEKVVSTPPYPPQVWSSFVSFASFSTSVMSSMASMTYYKSTFGGDLGLDVGIVISIALTALLIFLEVTQPALASRPVTILRKMRVNFSTLTWILLIIFLGMVYTRIVMVVSG